MLPMGNDTARRESSPLTGYIRVKNATQVVRSRMFSQEIPEAVLIAALGNADDASIRRSEQFGIKVEVDPTVVEVDSPSTALAKAICSGEIALFAMTEDSTRIFSISQNIVADVLAKADFPPTLATAYLRFLEMAPMSLLRGIEEGALQRSGGKTFGLILKESEFEGWLGRVARQNRWPLDKKARRAVGRPDRVSAVKPLVKLLVETGKWRGGDPFKQLVHSVNANLKGQEVSRGTIERALKQLYAEAGDLRYRQNKRRRQASPRGRNKRP
jgi:hypothetical protein